MHNLIYKNYRSFFKRSISQYDYQNYPVRVVGSSAFQYADILNEVADSFGVKIDLIQKNSLKGLVKFHTKEVVLE